MQNKLVVGSNYKWHRWQANGSSVSSITLGSTIDVASSYTITKSGDTFSCTLTTPTTYTINQSIWNTYTTSTTSGQTVTTPIVTNYIYMNYGDSVAINWNGAEASLILSGNTGSIQLTASESTIRSAIAAKAGKYIRFTAGKGTVDSNVYKLPASITTSNLTYDSSAGTWTFKLLTRQNLNTGSQVTSYDSLTYPTSGWSGSTYYIRMYAGFPNTNLAGKYFVIDSNMYYCDSANTGSSTTQTWQIDGGLVYSVALTTDVTSTSSSTYPTDGYRSPYYYVKYFSPYDIDDSYIYGGVNYEQVVNTEDDIEVGATASACVSFQVTDASQFTVGDAFDYYVKQANDSDWRLIGKFYTSSINKGKSRYTITAYDAISKFDVVIDDWLDELTFPITARDMLTSLCTYCGVTTDSSTFINSTMSLQDNFESTNLTGRYVLSYIAQLGAGFARCTPAGVLQIKTLGFETASLDNTKYVSLFYEDYSVNPITKVRVAYDEESEGCEAGTGTNVLGIYGNPLLYFDTTSEIQTNVNNIYNQLNANSTYVPMSIEMLEDYGINAGAKVTVDNKVTYIYTKSWTSEGVEFESTGNKDRALTNVNKNSEINALRGKVHKLTVDQEGIKSDVSDLTTKAHKTLTWDANTGLVVCDAVTGNTVKITGNNIETNAITADKITAGTISFDKLSSNVQSTITEGSVWRQTTRPTASTSEKTLESGSQWFLTGTPTDTSTTWVTNHSYAVNAFVNVTVSGTTYYYLNNTAHTSSGSSIDEDVDANGSTYWTQIYKNGWYYYDGTTWTLSSNPYYVKSTYIDKAELRSPTIRGNNILVNGDYGGSFQVQKQGLTVGFMGIGSAYDGTQTTYGLVMANNSDGQGTGLSDGDNYICITDAEAKLAFAYDQGGDTYYRTLYLNSSGIYYNDGQGNVIPLGYARFG